MADTVFSGPIVVFGRNALSNLGDNPDIAPSMFWGGVSLLDPRLPYTYLVGEGQAALDMAWLGADSITTLSIVPYTKAAAAIVASANPTSATLTLVTASSATTGVYITPSIPRADTGAVDTNGGLGLVALDAYCSVTASIAAGGILTVTANSTMPVSPGMVLLSSGTVSVGAIAGVQVVNQIAGVSTANGYVGTYQLSTNQLTAATGTVTLAYPNPNYCTVPCGAPGTPGTFLWNPQAMVARAVAITAASGASYATATVSGYDVYGYPMMEAITISAGSQVLGKKAFKYIKSVVLSGGTADTTHAYSVDTVDVFGLPLRSDTYGDIFVNYATSLTALAGITSASGYVVADATSPATTTTGDVRGTYVAVSSTATNKLVVRQSPQAFNIGQVASNTTGLFGQTHYANF